MPPTFENGKICYIEIPAADVEHSADWYKRMFGWQIRKTKEGRTSFDDAVGEVSGAWVLGRAPSTLVGLMVYIMVNDAVATVERIVTEGGKIVQPIGADAPEITARFTDPFGNIFGLYQQPE